MTTPVERVERLREETANASKGPWHDFDGAIWPLYDATDVATAEALAEMVLDRADQDADAEHIARWDPEAAAVVLGLVEAVLQLSLSPMTRDRAMAVLDVLDPPEAT